MKKVCFVFCLIVLNTMLFSKIIIRPGISSTTGLIGLELRMDNLSISGGYEGVHETSMMWEDNESKTVTCYGLTYYRGKNEDKSSPYSSLAVSINGWVHTESGGGIDEPVIEWGNVYSLIGGYNWVIHKNFDLKIGGGIAAAYAIGFAIDLSLGLRF